MHIDQFIAEVVLEHCKLIHAYVNDPVFAQTYRLILDAEQVAQGKRKRGRPKGPEWTEAMLHLALLNTHLTTRKYAKQLVDDPKHQNAKREEIKRAREALGGIEKRIEEIAGIRIKRFALKWKIHPDIVAYALDGAGNPREYANLVKLIEEHLESAEQHLHGIKASQMMQL
jgi:hypothetical protein